MLTGMKAFDTSHPDLTQVDLFEKAVFTSAAGTEPRSWAGRTSPLPRDKSQPLPYSSKVSYSLQPYWCFPARRTYATSSCVYV